MSHSCKWESKGVYWKYSGEVEGEEVVKACRSIYGDPRFDSLDYKVVDFLGIESLQMTERELLKIAFQDKAAEMTNPNVKSAIVMTVGADLGKKFASYFEDSSWEVEVFDDLEEANKWLGRKVA